MRGYGSFFFGFLVRRFQDTITNGKASCNLAKISKFGGHLTSQDPLGTHWETTEKQMSDCVNKSTAALNLPYCPICQAMSVWFGTFSATTRSALRFSGLWQILWLLHRTYKYQIDLKQRKFPWFHRTIVCEPKGGYTCWKSGQFFSNHDVIQPNLEKCQCRKRSCSSCNYFNAEGNKSRVMRFSTSSTAGNKFLIKSTRRTIIQMPVKVRASNSKFRCTYSGNMHNLENDLDLSWPCTVLLIIYVQ